MAITTITIIQDNKASGSDLLPIHSPLAFIAECEYTATAPDKLGVKLYITEGTNTLFGTYNAIYLSDPTATSRRFVFFANDAIKSIMPALGEVYQLNETLIDQEYTARILLKFYDPADENTNDTDTFVSLHAARQYGEVPNCTDVHTNANRTYYCKKGSHVYCYWYDSGVAATVDITDGGVDKGTFTITSDSLSSLQRYKTVATADKTVIFNNGIETSTATIKIIDDCTDGKELKYLDRNGMFRFFPFNQFFEITDAPELIGEIQNFVTNIQTVGAASRPVGYTTKRKYNLTASNVDSAQLEILSEIYSSPLVYMRIGATDTAADWLQVQVIGDGLIRRRKLNGGRVDIQVIVPEINNITLL